MKIGIVGLGIVGSACKKGFDLLGYETKIHDIKLNTRIENLLDTEIIYICVPTPSLEDGSCDTSVVESVVLELYDRQYTGIVAIKSTVPPGTTDKLKKIYNLQLAFVPEFLKERSAEYDFIHDHKLLLVGTDDRHIYDVIVRSHGTLPERSSKVKIVEAEITKYYHNSFNALRVVFANVFYEIATAMNADYDVIKQSFLDNNSLPDEYLDVNSNLRGFSGACLPKDVKACKKFCEDNDLDYSLFKTMLQDNEKFSPTVFEGMRNT